MANEKNLRPCEHKFTQEEAKKGGQNSAIARKERKLMQQRAQLLLGMALRKGKKTDIEDVKSLDTLNGKNIEVSDAILLKQIAKALKGDTVAAAFLRDTSGQKPIDKVATAEVDPDILAEIDRIVSNDGNTETDD